MTRLYLLISVALLAWPIDAVAQKKKEVAATFKFAIVEKTPAHPYYGIGHAMGFTVNGVEGDTLYVIRDSVYAIDFDTLRGSDMPIVYTQPKGRSRGIFEEWLIGDFLSENLIYFQATDDTPDTLYYGHFNYDYSGGTFVIVDSLPSSVEGPERNAPLLTSRVVPNPVYGAGAICLRSPLSREVEVEIIDVAGRTVSEHRIRANEGTEARVPIERDSLPSGVYFYRVIDAMTGNEVVAPGSFHVQ